MLDLCYLCGEQGATIPLVLKDSFTDHSLARSPDSDVWCSRCEFAVNFRGWYWNAGKEHGKGCGCGAEIHIGMWVVLFGRVSSWLISEAESFPVIGGLESHYPNEPVMGKEKQQGELQTISNLPTRSDMRRWLISPPEPPFRIAISESGKKHILPWAQIAYSRDCFPVMFEKDLMLIDRGKFIELLFQFERLLALSFSKTEILSGEYRSDRLIKVGMTGEWAEREEFISAYRGTCLLALISHVAQLEKT